MTARARPSSRLLPLAVVLILGACAETRYEGETGTVATAGTATVPEATAPAAQGAAAELLPRLVAEATDLSRRMIENDDDEDAAVRIDELWQAAREEVAATRPELLDNFDANVRRLGSAVEFNRAADADKAGVNLQALVDAFLG